MDSPTFIRTGVVQKKGTARHPYKKKRSWIPRYRDKITKRDIKAVAEVRPIDFNLTKYIPGILSGGHIPGGKSWKLSRMQFLGASTPQIVTNATGRDMTTLQTLRKQLVGSVSVDKLSKDAQYTVRVIFPTQLDEPRFGNMIYELLDKTNLYAHLRTHLRHYTAPLYFAGLHPQLRGYVIVTGTPDSMLSDTRADVGAITVYNRMIELGVYPLTSRIMRHTRQKRPSTNTPPNSTKSMYIQSYVIEDPLLLIEIPKNIHAAYTKYLQSEGHGRAWVSSGGAAWSDLDDNIEFRLQHAHRYDQVEPVTLNETLSYHLERIIQRPEIGKNSRRLLDEGVVQSLHTLTTSGKKLGSGAYGDVYHVQMQGKHRSNLRHLLNLQGGMSNVLSFRDVHDLSDLVIKIERLDPIRVLTRDEVHKLSGESFIQQYVHTNSGLRLSNRAPVVAPEVYFSGTLANRYHLICMARVPGKPLYHYTKRGLVSDGVYNAMNVAIKTLLRNGVVHSDLHQLNVFIHKHGGTTRAIILDYGFATVVPPALKRKIVRVLDSTNSVDQAFVSTGLVNVINASKLGYDYYHSNMKMMRLLNNTRSFGPKTGLRSYIIDNISRGSAGKAGKVGSTPTTARRRIATRMKTPRYKRPSNPARRSTASTKKTSQLTQSISRPMRTARS